MGAAGFRDHIVVCGWNSTARELIAELEGDEFTTKVVVIHDVEKNPAGEGVYFVSGDITRVDDLKRAGIEEAMAAVICPADGSNEADMKSILCCMAIESVAPDCRTVVEANNPAHVEHFQRAEADEIVVSSRLVSRLMARSSLYPGLAELVTDIVSGGEGSELYRVSLPDNCVGLSVDELSAKLRADHRATLLSISRDGVAHVNPAAGLPAPDRRRPRRHRRVARRARPAGDGPLRQGLRATSRQRRGELDREAPCGGAVGGRGRARQVRRRVHRPPRAHRRRSRPLGRHGRRRAPHRSGPGLRRRGRAGAGPHAAGLGRGGLRGRPGRRRVRPRRPDGALGGPAVRRRQRLLRHRGQRVRDLQSLS